MTEKQMVARLLLLGFQLPTKDLDSLSYTIADNLYYETRLAIHGMHSGFPTTTVSRVKILKAPDGGTTPGVSTPPTNAPDEYVVTGSRCHKAFKINPAGRKRLVHFVGVQLDANGG